MPSARFTPEYDPVFEPRTAAPAEPDDGDARGDDPLANGEATTEATADRSGKPLNPS